MEYEINVSYEGKHFFRVNGSTIYTLERAAVVYAALVMRFPTEIGFKITVYEVPQVRNDVTQPVEDTLRRQEP